jgi:hypothetical protein
MKIFYQDEHKNKCSKIRWHSCTFQAIWHMLYCRTVFYYYCQKLPFLFKKMFLFCFSYSDNKEPAMVPEFSLPCLTTTLQRCLPIQKPATKNFHSEKANSSKWAKTKTIRFIIWTFSFWHEFKRNKYNGTFYVKTFFSFLTKLTFHYIFNYA